MARHHHLLGGLIPHSYEITDRDGNHVGAITGQLSPTDRYEVTVHDATGVPPGGTPAAAMVTDAMRWD